MNAFLDSNVLIYSLTSRSPKKKSSQEFIRINKDILCVSHQVILESFRVLTHQKFAYPMKGDKAIRSIWKIADALRIISPNTDAIAITKELVKKYNIISNRIFDAYLVATALSNSIGIIATDNEKHFKTYQEIKVLNPFT